MDRKCHSHHAYVLLAICFASSPFSHALEEISEEEMSQSTGEGIALLPEDFYIRFNDNARDASGAYDASNTTQVLDAGYIRFIPVGPVSPSRRNVGFDKADLYLYGFSYSQSEKLLGQSREDSDLSSGFGRAIDSWGTEKNPWVIQTETQNDVPSFNAGNKKDVSYFGVNAPEFDNTVYGQAKADIAADTYDPTKYAAYNLKMSWWGDVYLRDSDVVENGMEGLSERLRINATWDGVSLNGSHIRVFQTLDGAESVNLPSSYNNTLGVNGLLRLNGGDATQLRAKVVRNVTDAAQWNIISDGGGSSEAPTLGEPAENKYRERIRQHTVTGNETWTAPAAASVLQLSTRETGVDKVKDLTTPALGGALPSFDPTSGIFMYNPNINLPLGQLYQPLMIDTNGNNISLELARIPNNPEVYRLHNQQYELNDYETWTGLGSANSIVGQDAVGSGNYHGNTCNFNQCGKTVSGKFYPATHGSITIGSAAYNSAKNHTSAYAGKDAVGVSFGKLENNTVNVDTSYISAIQYQRRRDNLLLPWRWQYLGADGWGDRTDERDWDVANPAWFDLGGTSPIAPDSQTPTTVTRYSDTGRNYQLSEIRNSPPIINSSPVNNLGSVAIDGLSIQYLKFTTTN